MVARRWLALLLAMGCAFWPAAAGAQGGAAFLSACLGSANLLPMVAGDPASLPPLCDCLVRDFATTLSPEDVDYLARDLRGEIAPEDRVVLDAGGRLENYAGAALGACLALEGLGGAGASQ